MKNKDRISCITSALLKVGAGDYSVQLDLSGKNDEIDALAMGINMMIDDLRNNVSEIEIQNRNLQQLNKELSLAKEKAEESDRLKSVFLANVSHEIRTPMNAILGFTDLIKAKELTPEIQQEYAGIINNSCKLLLKVIDDIVVISLIEAGQLEIHKSIFDVTHLVKRLVNVFNDEYRDKTNTNIELRFNNLYRDRSFRILSDDVRVTQIISIMIRNAFKFTESGYVEIGFKPLNENNRIFLELYVKDTGCGIPESSYNKIFNRFSNVSGGGFIEGSGLGLSIAKGLATLLGGAIRFESEVGKGSTFYFTLPLE